MPAHATQHHLQPLIWTMRYPSHERSVGLLRREVKRLLRDVACSADDAEAIILVCGELAANAVQHGCPPGAEFTARVAVTSQDCLIEVTDELATPPRRRNPTERDEHGRGLQLVAALSTDLGHRRETAGGKTIWARISLANPTL